MATFKVRNERTTVEIRKRSHTLARTFKSSRTAKSWALQVEGAIEAEHERAVPFLKAYWMASGWTPNGTPEPVPEAPQIDPDSDEIPRVDWTLFKALDHYGNVQAGTLRKKGSLQETVRIKWWQKKEISLKRINEITKSELQTHVNKRVQDGKSPTTVRNEIYLVGSVYRYLIDIWQLNLVNPVPELKLPRVKAGRDRRINDDEITKIREALLEGLNPQEMTDLFNLAIETGMRMSEIFSLTVAEVRRDPAGAYVQKNHHKTEFHKDGTPTGIVRKIYLTEEAEEILNRLVEGHKGSPVNRLFDLERNDITYRFKCARELAGITDLHFHDTRHEAISKLFDMGLTIPEVSSQSGHKDLKSLAIYSQSRGKNIVAKIRKREP